MNTQNYDRIIDLYLDGALGPVEEREFRNLLEIDPDLRRLLDAELAVRRTLEEDAEAVPVETERSYARFVAALAATAPAAEGGSDGGAAAGGSASNGASGWMGAGLMKFAATAVVTLGLATGGYFALSDRDTAVETSSERTAPAATTTTSSPIELEQPALNTATPSRGVGTDLPEASATTETAPQRTGAAAGRVETKGVVTAPETKASPLVDPKGDLGELEERATQSEEDLPVIESDSVSTRVRFNMKSPR
jgi:hypothetical protein